MSTGKKEDLIQIAHTYYPPKSSAALPDRATPETRLFEEAWNRAIRWKECDALIQALQAAFPMDRVARFMQPWKAACIYCILLRERRDHLGGRHLTRIVGAISVLAPLYLIYMTMESIDAARPSPPPQPIFSLEGPERPHADLLAELIEQHLGYSPFPLELANVPLSNIHVDYLHSGQPTLLTAFFANRLEDLP